MSTASICITTRDRLDVQAYVPDHHAGPHLSIYADGVNVAMFLNVQQIEQIEAGLAALRMEIAAAEAKQHDAAVVDLNARRLA